jgi:hypothetical protein
MFVPSARTPEFYYDGRVRVEHEAEAGPTLENGRAP